MLCRRYALSLCFAVSAGCLAGEYEDVNLDLARAQDVGDPLDLAQPQPDLGSAPDLTEPAPDLLPQCDPLDFDITAWQAQMPALLSETKLYANVATKTLRATAHEYVPKYPFFSDGAQKSRYIDVPCGTRIDTTDADDWQFPTGTRIWKEFRDGTGARTETRVMVKVSATAWQFARYFWRTDETDADLEPPSPQFCAGCHDGKNVLGMSNVQARPETISGWLNAGRVTTPVVEYVPPGSAFDGAALGYFHANCGACHERRNEVIQFRLKTTDLTRAATKLFTTGVGVDTGRTDYPKYIQPGDALQSWVLWRIQLGQMPQSTTVVDSGALLALVDWVQQLQP